MAECYRGGRRIVFSPTTTPIVDRSVAAVHSQQLGRTGEERVKRVATAFSALLLAFPSLGIERQREFNNADIERVLRERPAPASRSSASSRIYLRKPANAGTFWASSRCHHHDANTIHVVNVPPNFTFLEKVRHAERMRNEQAQAESNRTTARQNARECRAIDDEVAAIWKRYDNWQFNSQAQIGRDQQRTRELRGQRS